mmetsp:Transcript_7286/g.13831  ORF Transcript_7286/g.13831 Transcript_7286/m.13831 type:complete len:484 (+) Transcript_7286:88-1539(+)
MNLIILPLIYFVGTALFKEQKETWRPYRTISTPVRLHSSSSTSSSNNNDMNMNSLLQGKDGKKELKLSEQEQFMSPIVMNQGRTASFMLAWPSITTFTLVKGWNHETTEQLKRAVQKVVRENPILGGRATMSNFFHTKISVVPAAENEFQNPKNEQDFVHEIVLESDALDKISEMDLQSMSETDILHFMDDFLAPIVPKPKSVIESIQSGAPLFRIDLIQLPNDIACYVMTMSHCIGDGVTYYNIMDEIHHEMRHDRKHEKKIIWSHPDIANHEIFPRRFSNKDVEIAYGGPFFLGLLKNVVDMDQQKKSYIILDKDKVSQKKKEFAENGQGHVSDNDVITVALCQANGSSDIFAFAMNMRDRHCHYGGNFHNEIPFAKKNALEPRMFRNIVKNGFDFDTNELPICPFVIGRSGRISSLASIQKLIETTDGADAIICHSMLSSFVQNVPMDTAFVISMNSKSYVVLHNFREINTETGLIHEIQ